MLLFTLWMMVLITILALLEFYFMKTNSKFKLILKKLTIPNLLILKMNIRSWI